MLSASMIAMTRWRRAERALQVGGELGFVTTAALGETHSQTELEPYAGTMGGNNLAPEAGRLGEQDDTGLYPLHR
jgi:hypothetical protein